MDTPDGVYGVRNQHVTGEGARWDSSQCEDMSECTSGRMTPTGT